MNPPDLIMAAAPEHLSAEEEAKIERVDAYLQKAVEASIKESLPLTTTYTMFMFYATDLMEQVRAHRKHVVDSKEKKE